MLFKRLSRTLTQPGRVESRSGVQSCRHTMYNRTGVLSTGRRRSMGWEGPSVSSVHLCSAYVRCKSTTRIPPPMRSNTQLALRNNDRWVLLPAMVSLYDQIRASTGAQDSLGLSQPSPWRQILERSLVYAQAYSDLDSSTCSNRRPCEFAKLEGIHIPYGVNANPN